MFSKFFFAALGVACAAGAVFTGDLAKVDRATAWHLSPAWVLLAATSGASLTVAAAAALDDAMGA